MKTTLDQVRNRHHKELRQVAQVQEMLLSTFTQHGCQLVETPVFEDYDSYSKAFPHLRKQFIKTLDTDGTVLVLRPDITMPVVKSLAQEYSDPHAYLKIAYITSVFMDYQGRHRDGREFLQGGVEILGSNQADCDSEVIGMAMHLLEGLGIQEMQVDIGTVAFSEAFFKELPLTPAQLSTIKDGIEARNIDALDGLCESYGITGDTRALILEMPTLFGPYEEARERARALCRNEGMRAALDRLEVIVTQLQWMYPEGSFYLDFAFSNRLNYYTDTVFKIYAPNAPYALVDGGRYNSMSASFGVDRPACGFGINITLLCEYLAENEHLRMVEPLFDLLLSYDGVTKEAIQLVQRLRNKGVSVVCNPPQGVVNEEEYRLKAAFVNGAFTVGNHSYDANGFFDYVVDTLATMGKGRE